MLLAAIPQLPMSDIEETENFYTEKLGFEVVGKMTEPKYLNVNWDNAMTYFLGYEETDGFDTFIVCTTSLAGES